ncbi:hypothetical protein JOE25_005346 [Serratia sp. PL17]|jgi:hypothetical protein|nr:hypothetical protein [Serratia sp. PL17]
MFSRKPTCFTYLNDLSAKKGKALIRGQYDTPARPVVVGMYGRYCASSLTRTLRSGRETAAGAADDHAVVREDVGEKKEQGKGRGEPVFS